MQCLCGKQIELESSRLLHDHLAAEHPLIFNGSKPTYKCICGYEDSRHDKMLLHFNGLDDMARKHHLVLLALSGG